MALEDALSRLAIAVERRSQDAAVAEIIKQRDEAISDRNRWKRDADWYVQDRDDYYKKLQTEYRRTRALRAVIKRMKAVPHVD